MRRRSWRGLASKASQNGKMSIGLRQKREERSVGPKKKKAIVSALQVFLYKTIIPYLSEKSNPFFSCVSKKSQGSIDPGSVQTPRSPSCREILVKKLLALLVGVHCTVIVNLCPVQPDVVIFRLLLLVAYEHIASFGNLLRLAWRRPLRQEASLQSWGLLPGVLLLRHFPKRSR